MRRRGPHRHARSRRARRDRAWRALSSADLHPRCASRRLSLFGWAADLDRAERGVRAGAAEEGGTAAKETDVDITFKLSRHRSLNLSAHGEPFVLGARERISGVRARL